MTFGMFPLSSLLDLTTNIASVILDQFSIISVKTMNPKSQVIEEKGVSR